MKTAYIFHDAFCDPISDWYPWMKTTLEGMGYVVVVPKFPTPAGQSYESWKAVLRNYLDKFDNETIFIGHGTGGVFALRLLENSRVQIAGTFLVASYSEALGHAGYDRVNETFIKQPFNWEKIKNNTHTIKVFAGENDPFVHSDVTDRLAEKLDTIPSIIPGGEHINKASGFTQCVQVLQGIKEGLGEIEKSMVIETPPRLTLDSSVSLAAANSSWQEEQSTPSTLESISPSYQEGVAEGRGSLEKKTGVEVLSSVSHTMYQDMSRLINSNDGKITSSLLNKARAEEAAKKINTIKNPINGLYLVGIFAVIIALIGIGMIYITKIAPAQKNSLAPAIVSLLPADVHQKINISNNADYELNQAIRDTLAKIPETGGITDVYYTRGNLRASFNDVLTNLDITNIPDSITSEFIPAGVINRPVFMHGVINLDSKQGHFIVLPVSHYDRAFAGMKDWEPSMFHDLGIFMNIPDTELRTRLDKDTFIDELINNKQVRTLRDSDGKILLAYFFLNEHTVIVVDNLEEIPIILTKSANSQTYQ